MTAETPNNSNQGSGEKDELDRGQIGEKMREESKKKPIKRVNLKSDGLLTRVEIDRILKIAIR